PPEGQARMLRQRTPIPSLIFALLAAAASMALGSAPASAATTFSNSNAITIPDHGKASPYPSAIGVSGMPGRITDVAVTLRGFSHTTASDVGVLLVSPDGVGSVVMAYACYSNVPGATWTFSQVPEAPLLP